MSTVNEIRQKINSVSQLKQMSDAMYLISVSRLRSALQGMEHSFRYIDSLRSVMSDLLHVTNGAGIKNYYLAIDDSGTSLFLPVMSDKGLCGDYNTDIASLTAEEMKKRPGAKLYGLGTLGKEKLLSRGLTPDKVIPGSSMHPSIHLARTIAKELTDMYNTKEVNEVYVVYTPYSKGEKKPVCFRLLPLLKEDFTDVADNELPRELLFEPSAQEVLDTVVPMYCTGMIYEMLLQSSASENSARMAAMQTAGSSADEKITQLQNDMNAARQLSITNEITEIAAAKSVQGI